MGESEEQRVSVIRSIRNTVGKDVPILIQGANSIRDVSSLTQTVAVCCSDL